MFCKNCGTKLKDGVAFCPNCGTEVTAKPEEAKTEVTNTTANATANATPEVPYAQPAASAPVEPKVKKPLDKKIVIGIIAVLAVVIGFVVFKMMPKKYNLEDYVKVEFEGYNKYGTARAYLDYDKLLEDIVKDKSKKGKKSIEDIDSWEDIGIALKDGYKLEEAIESVEIKLDKEYDHLKNGDEVKVTIKYDEKACKEADVRFKGSSVTKKVEGLDEVEEKDPFADLLVKFSGTAPDGYIEMEYIGSLEGVSEYSFSVDKSSGLSNGDVVTVTFGDGSDFLSYGFVPKVDKMEYTVEGLDEYVSKFDDLSSEFVETLKSDSEDAIVAYVANSYNKEVKMKDLTYAGYAMNTLMPEQYGSNNILVMLYKANVSHKDKDFEATTVYYTVTIENILNSNGTFSYNGTPYLNGGFYLGNYYTYGYASAFDAYMDLVASRAENYTSECSDEFAKFADFSFIGSLSDVSDAGKQDMIEDAKKTVKAYVKDCYYMKSVKDLKNVGAYLLKAKDSSSNYENQAIYVVVLSGTVTPDGDQFKKAKVFFPVVFKGAVKLSDGSNAYIENGGITGETYFDDSYYETRGYIDGETMYSELISANRDEYTYEVSTELKEFGE